MLKYVLRTVITQARGLRKHMKRLNAPKHWMLDKLGVAFPRSHLLDPISRGSSFLVQRHIQVNGKLRTDKTYPTGFMDVFSIPKTNENFRFSMIPMYVSIFTPSGTRKLSLSFTRFSLSISDKRAYP